MLLEKTLIYKLYVINYNGPASQFYDNIHKPPYDSKGPLLSTANQLSMLRFVWFDSWRPINNLSVIKGRVFLGWTSTKLGLMFLLKGTTHWRRRL